MQVPNPHILNALEENPARTDIPKAGRLSLTSHKPWYFSQISRFVVIVTARKPNFHQFFDPLEKLNAVVIHAIFRRCHAHRALV